MADMPTRCRNAIEDYYAANTDSPDMPDHTEAVLMLCAFEWLFAFDFAKETEENKHPWCELDTEGTLRAMIELSMREQMAGK